MTGTILLTGAAGKLGQVLRRGLAPGFPALRVTDRQEFAALRPDEDIRIADLCNPAAVVGLCTGIRTVIHFAGIPDDAPWPDLRRANLDVTYNILEAAQQTGVQRVILASTNRTVSYHRLDRRLAPTDPPRPDGPYAATKVFTEVLGRLYADRHGLNVACLRIGSFRPHPETERHLANWISPADLVRAVEACIAAPPFRFEIVFTSSNNARMQWQNDPNSAIRFTPQDNAEDHSATVPPGSGYGTGAARRHGGTFAPLAPLRRDGV